MSISYGYSLIVEGEPARLLTEDEKRLVLIAAGLISDDEGDNPEYDRAAAEIVCEFLGLPTTDTKEAILASLRTLARERFDRHADQALEVVADDTGSIDRIY